MGSLRPDSGKLYAAPPLRTIHRSELLAYDHAQSPAPAFGKAPARDLKFRREIFQKMVRCRMELQGGRNKIDERRRLLQSDPLKITIASDLSALRLPTNAQPIVRCLQRQMDVLASLSSRTASLPEQVTVRRSRMPCSPPALAKTCAYTHR